jgi:PPK2 family polyphosphate:nucleotide phosphotransferase
VQSGLRRAIGNLRIVDVMAKPILFDPIENPYLVPFDGGFKLDKAATKPPDDAPGKKDNIRELGEEVQKLTALQAKLYAHDRYSVLLIFQALDAAGKDGTIRAVMSGVNPQGCHVTAFKQPSHEELDHDFLWRVQRALPERGRIGIWNRSHYEEVLVVRVHPEYLGAQRLPNVPKNLDDLWQERFESINDAEKHWARNGTVILKFFLHVSQEEQHVRFIDRIVDPDANWKFSPGDIRESERYADYQKAYDAMLRATSKPWAPWYCIPADKKPYMRRVIAETIVATMKELPLAYPTVTAEQRAEMEKYRLKLEAEAAGRK